MTDNRNGVKLGEYLTSELKEQFQILPQVFLPKDEAELDSFIERFGQYRDLVLTNPNLKETRLKLLQPISVTNFPELNDFAAEFQPVIHAALAEIVKKSHHGVDIELDLVLRLLTSDGMFKTHDYGFVQQVLMTIISDVYSGNDIFSSFPEEKRNRYILRMADYLIMSAYLSEAQINNESKTL